MRLFKPSFDLRKALELTRDRGYAFVANALEDDVCQGMQNEINRLPLEVGDHVTYPIGEHAKNEVRQLHARAYRMIDDPEVPYGSQICRRLFEAVQDAQIFPDELRDWLLNEIGYQRYRSSSDWISPHRDRKSDDLLSVTLTISGFAWVHMYKPETDPPDYKRLQRVDSFLTGPGTVMCLRAPGFGSGLQEIHEVMPPEEGVRDILNLRKRRILLPRPGKELVTI